MSPVRTDPPCPGWDPAPAPPSHGPLLLHGSCSLSRCPHCHTGPRFFPLISPPTTATPGAGVDELGVPVSWEASGWAARIIQHEMDHLDGILYIDRMDPRTFTNVGWMELLD
ncbi:hypothetical protein DV515_00016697 [Chloebia gouldiae]|uniref:Peptide deformylase n=1 Tax=Chloebia gouldiae TaxID=44316 RepID=A0A3L8RT54_CHLGU|nr:hypothetical protein DV515_00016697 [Chloebia gouldiae]